MSSAATKKTQDNMNQKLALVIKSGKYRLGKFLPVPQTEMLRDFHASNADGPDDQYERCDLLMRVRVDFRLQVCPQVTETGSIQAHPYL